jgi:hypothetical protein
MARSPLVGVVVEATTLRVRASGVWGSGFLRGAPLSGGP